MERLGQLRAQMHCVQADRIDLCTVPRSDELAGRRQPIGAAWASPGETATGLKRKRARYQQNPRPPLAVPLLDSPSSFLSQRHAFLDIPANQPHAAAARFESPAMSRLTEAPFVGGGHLAATSRDLRCCCGNVECAFLQHGNLALDALETDVRTVAQLGQALLVRHEAYIADAEQERSKLTASLSTLDVERKELEAQNAKIVAENKALLEQIEGLNNALADSDAHLKSLSATLHSSQYELQKLNGLASRTQQLEMQLSQLEEEQAQLQATLATTEEDKRIVAAQWGECQRNVVRLEEQMETIEREAREERVRHEDVLERMRRTRAVEKELETAAGRLKGAAAGKNGSQEYRTSNVVSSFVKEILEDNAKLQLNMVELQEMLARSTEEVETLRQQVLSSDDLTPDTEEIARRQSLSVELGAERPVRPASQELHVHHHYHAPGASSQGAARGRSAVAQRPRRRRTIVSSGRSSLSHSPNRVSEYDDLDSSITGSDSPRRLKRWSGISHHTRSSITSSGPGSPPSSCCPSTIFELPYNGEPIEFSRPTSPDSSVWSPPLKPSEGKDVSTDSCYNALSPLCSHETNDSPNYAEDVSAKNPSTSLQPADKTPLPQSLLAQVHSTSLMLDEASEDPLEASVSTLKASPPTTDEPLRKPTFLRRTNSTDSLLSISGMDIHSSAPQLKKRPSHLLAFRTSDSKNTGPVLTATSASALRSGIKSPGIEAANARGVLRSSLGNENRDTYAPLQDTLGKKLGGWLSGRWTSGSNTSNTDSKSRTASADASMRSVSVSSKKSTQESVVDTIGTVSEADESKEVEIAPSLRRVKTGRMLIGELDEEALKECLEVDG